MTYGAQRGYQGGRDDNPLVRRESNPLAASGPWVDLVLTRVV